MHNRHQYRGEHDPCVGRQLDQVVVVRMWTGGRLGQPRGQNIASQHSTA
jgi:hypothetical protein